EWHPKTDTVTYEGKDKEGKPMKVTYKRSELDSQSDAVKTQIDPGFVNDQYWLVLPFHVAWDGATVTDEGVHETPLGKTSAHKIVAKYAASGYSPGDTWELYIGPDKRVVEMSYHRAVPVPKLPNLVHAKWEGYKKAGPLLFATEHHGTADGNPFELTFTDVAVKTKGSKDLITAKWRLGAPPRGRPGPGNPLQPSIRGAAACAAHPSGALEEDRIESQTPAVSMHGEDHHEHEQEEVRPRPLAFGIVE